MKLSEQSGKEFVAMANSEELRRDMRHVKSRTRRIDIDQFLEFVTVYNDFINHAPKPFKRIKDDRMIL